MFLSAKPWDEPFYVGFDAGGYELGLLPAGMSDPTGGPSVVAYWGVEDIAGEYKRLLELGATERNAIEEVGATPLASVPARTHP